MTYDFFLLSFIKKQSCGRIAPVHSQDFVLLVVLHLCGRAADFLQNGDGMVLLFGKMV